MNWDDPGLPFSQACENNKTFILEKLLLAFARCSTALELASGTGQHAAWFAEHMPWLNWQPTDVPVNLANLKPRCDRYSGSNLMAPLALDVFDQPWQVFVPEAVFTANSLHIMPWAGVESLFEGLARESGHPKVLAVYGPFNYGGAYTSESNARFDIWLGQQSPYSAIRDFEQVDGLARNAGLVLESDYEMPANNRLLVWRRSG